MARQETVWFACFFPAAIALAGCDVIIGANPWKPIGDAGAMSCPDDGGAACGVDSPCGGCAGDPCALDDDCQSGVCNMKLLTCDP